MSLSNCFVIGDTHFGDPVTAKERKFESLEAMEDLLIKNWNGTIKKEATVVVLGDFSDGSKTSTAKIIDELAGQKVLIVGNHDKFHKSWYIDNGFSFATDAIIDNGLLLTHRPAYQLNPGWGKASLCEHISYDFIRRNIHAHSHYPVVTSSEYVNVTAEAVGYTPKKLYKAIREWDNIFDCLGGIDAE